MRNLRVGQWQVKDTNVLAGNGLIRINPNKPGFGSIMLVEDVVDVSGGGFARKRNKTGFITGTITDLEAIIHQYGLKVNDNFNEKVGKEFKIVTHEMLENQAPEGRSFKAKINPRTGEALVSQGQKIFWRRFVVEANSPETDILIQHDNVQSTGKRGEQHYEGLNEEAAKEFKAAASKQVAGK